MRWFLLLLFCCQASQPTSTELTRTRRELIECCPCNGEDTLARSSQLAASRVDDCPCRARGADSEGASSVFFPSAVRVDGTNMRSNNPKEEQKNLLEPEVGLATSMLETLREATEEEYQDALARDAARSAADARSDESKNLVIVVEPTSEDKDLIPRASQVQESRFRNPLGSSLNIMRTPTESNPDTIRLRRPSVPYRNLFDMDTDVGASNVEEVVSDAKGHSPLVKTPLLRSNIPKITSPENVDEDSDSATSKVYPLLGISKVKRLLEGLRLPPIPDLKLKDPALRNAGDVSLAPSSNLEIFDDPGIPRFIKRPTLLKNLLNLKDVELIPPDKLFKKPLFGLPKTTVPNPRSQVDENCDDNESRERNVLNKSELKQLNFVTKSKTEHPLKTGRESEDKRDTEDCIDETNRSMNENLDVIGNPSNIRTTALENPENGFSAPEDQNNSNEQRIKDSDLDSTPLVEQSKSTEIEDSRVDENCQDLSNFEQTATNDSEMKSTDDFDNDSTAKEEIASREILSEDQDTFTDSSNVNNVITEPSNTIESPISDDSVQDENISSVIEDTFTDSSNVNNVITEPSNTIESPISDDSVQDENFSSAIEDPSQVSNSEIFPQNTEGENSPINKNQALKPVSSLSDTLSAIRDNIHRLDQFIRTNRKPSLNRVDDNPKDNINQKDSTNDSGLSSNDDDTIIIFDKSGNPEVIESKNAKKSKSVTLDDLQKLSDNLLDSSNRNQKFIAKSELENKQSEMKSDINNLEEKTDVVNNLTEENSLPIATEERDGDALTEKTCLKSSNNDDVTEKSSPRVKSVSQDSEPRDMKVDASEPIMSVLPKVLDPLNLSDRFKSPIFRNTVAQPSLNLDPLNLLQNPIVQPSLPANPLNLLNNPLDDLINKNPTLPPLPSLDDIRDQISNVFNTNERTADDAEEDCDYDEKEIEKMAPEASTTNTQTKLPTIKPLDNLNVDLFQLGPMKSPQPDPLGSNRKINLNSFRTKLPVPKNFELKPVKLESSIRNKDELQRSSVRLSSKSPIMKTKQFNLLGTPGVKFPSLDEIRESLHRNPTTLLGNPIRHDLNLFKPRAFEDIGNNAEKAIKGIQKRLRASSKSPKIAEPAIANPQEFLDEVGDKLKAIHHDLNDRLTSVHDNFLESTRLALPSPILGANDKKISKNMKPIFRTTNAKPMRLQTQASTRSPQRVNSPTEKSIPKTSGFPQSKSASQKMLSKLKNQDFAASDPVPVKTLPNSQIRTSTKDARQFSIQRLGERGPFTKLSIPKPIFRKLNLKENKVIITFEPTTSKPIMRSDNSITESRTPKINGVETGNDFENRGLSRNTKANAGIDRASSSPEVNPWKDQQPVQLPSRLQTDNQKGISKLRNKLSSFNPNTRISRMDKDKLLGKENAFFSKVNDAVKLRLAHLDSLKKGKVGKADPKPILKASNDRNEVTSSDMLKSASENVNAVAVQEPLKENVSYKCKLVCTKE